MRYGSICSGIEAASAAWEPMGWTPAWLSEIEPFPCEVLRHRVPDAPNLGDMTKITNDELERHGAIDVLIGGTPCQSFSVAGRRAGLDDPRGVLAFEFLRIAGAARPCWMVWENVPGVLSSDGGRDFAAIIGTMVELGYGVAWRVLDAQHFGVPQRRRRVFVVGCLGGWAGAAAVLFEHACLSGDFTPGGEAGTDIARAVTTRSGGASGKEQQETFIPEVVPAVTAKAAKGTGGPSGDECQNLIAIQGIGKRTGRSTENTQHGIGIMESNGPMYTLQANEQHAIAHTLRADGFDASEDGTGRGTPLIAQDIAPPLRTQRNNSNAGSELKTLVFSAKDNGRDISDGVCPTLRAGQHDASHANGGNAPAVAFEPESIARNAGPCGESKIASTLRSEMGDNQTAMRQGMTVRRPTPLECERLQGFPDHWTLIPWRNRRPKDYDDMIPYIMAAGFSREDAERLAMTPDGPRYRALGNSMAVPVIRWIGERIALVDEIMRDCVK